jgi:hypothetical protein
MSSPGDTAHLIAADSSALLGSQDITECLLLRREVMRLNLHPVGVSILHLHDIWQRVFAFRQFVSADR